MKNLCFRMIQDAVNKIRLFASFYGGQYRYIAVEMSKHRPGRIPGQLLP